MSTHFEVRDGLGQVHTFETRREAQVFAAQRGKFTWAQVHSV